jgi:replicative DNA helicase
VVVCTDRGDRYRPHDTDGGSRLLIAKQRNGPLASVRLTFPTGDVRFEPAAWPHHPQLLVRGAA